MSNKFNTYYNSLQDKIKENELEDFWLLCENKSFKPIKNISLSWIKKYIKEKPEFYANKHLANIVFLFRDPKTTKDTDWIFAIRIYIYKINDKGDIHCGTCHEWNLLIKYNKNELDENNFKINKLKNMIKLAQKRKVESDLSGISYSKWIGLLSKYKSKNKRSTKL